MQGKYKIKKCSSGIHIKPENKGKFTTKANSHGEGVQEFANEVMSNKEDYSTSTVKQANFARIFGNKKYKLKNK